MIYSEKLKDPKWQQIRLKVLERDNWCCQLCYDNLNTLHVHHRIYLPNIEPWDYPLANFITLCEKCHEKEKIERKQVEQRLLDALKINFLSGQLIELEEAFRLMPIDSVPEVLVSAICWNIINNQQTLLDNYFGAISHGKNKNN